MAKLEHLICPKVGGTNPLAPPPPTFSYALVRYFTNLPHIMNGWSIPFSFCQKAVFYI